MSAVDDICHMTPTNMPQQLDFDAEAHVYKYNGKRVPSVTQILEPLMNFDGIPWEVLETARIFGGHCASACHMLNCGTLDWGSLHDELAAYIHGYDKFLTQSGFVMLASEERLYSPKYGYAGTLDLRGVFGKKRALIDTKSTAAFPRSVSAQTSGYQQALLETHDEKIDQRFCLLLRPYNYKLYPLKDGAGIQDWSVFLSCLNIWKYRNASA